MSRKLGKVEIKLGIEVANCDFCGRVGITDPHLSVENALLLSYLDDYFSIIEMEKCIACGRDFCCDCTNLQEFLCPECEPKYIVDFVGDDLCITDKETHVTLTKKYDDLEIPYANSEKLYDENLPTIKSIMKEMEK